MNDYLAPREGDLSPGETKLRELHRVIESARDRLTEGCSNPERRRSSGPGSRIVAEVVEAAVESAVARVVSPARILREASDAALINRLDSRQRIATETQTLREARQRLTEETVGKRPLTEASMSELGELIDSTLTQASPPPSSPNLAQQAGLERLAGTQVISLGRSTSATKPSARPSPTGL